jgi:hypothetical protein
VYYLELSLRDHRVQDLPGRRARLAAVCYPFLALIAGGMVAAVFCGLIGISRSAPEKRTWQSRPWLPEIVRAMIDSPSA